MAAFEFGNYQANKNQQPEDAFCAHDDNTHLPAPTFSEPILAMKIYDSCRSKDCLGPPELGPARHHNGQLIEPPEDARSVILENTKVARIVVMKKEPSSFRKGFWDLEIQYVLHYELRFFGPEGRHLGTVPAVSTFTKRCSLFGSVGQEVSLFTDLLGGGDTLTGGGEPFVLIEAKVMPLAAEIVRRHCRKSEGESQERRVRVLVTLGLFTIIKLYRFVSLMVESRGFVIPPPCRDVMPPNPCDFFEDLDFPLDSFSPPQKKEFMAGISSNIPTSTTQTIEIKEE